MWYPIKASCGGYAATAMAGGTYRDALLIRSLAKEAGTALGISNICGQVGLFNAVPTGNVATACVKVCCK